MRELTDAERLIGRLEYEPVVIRRRCEGRFVRGRVLAVGGRGAADRRDGVLFVLVEVRADAAVEEPHRQVQPLSKEELAEVAQTMALTIPMPEPPKGAAN